jgi:hypothetical protein
MAQMVEHPASARPGVQTPELPRKTEKKNERRKERRRKKEKTKTQLLPL